MTIFAVNLSHTPESCPMFNKEVKEKFKWVAAKRKEIAEKHEVKILSSYTSILDHLLFSIVEAPSQQSVENYFVETGVAFWNKVEIREVKPVEDMIKKIVEE